MSLNYKDQIFSSISNDDIARIVGVALRTDFKKGFAAVKWISMRTKASLPTIRNWYEGRHTPSAGNLLLLAKDSPTLMKFVLEHLGGPELWEVFQLCDDIKNRNSKATESYKDDPLNVPIELNQRQKWFLIFLKSGQNIRAVHIVEEWLVSIKTARRDIRRLKDAGIIRYIGPKKTGYYVYIYRLQEHYETTDL